MGVDYGYNYYDMYINGKIESSLEVAPGTN
jgi:hypothetical protein